MGSELTKAFMYLAIFKLPDLDERTRKGYLEKGFVNNGEYKSLAKDEIALTFVSNKVMKNIIYRLDELEVAKGLELVGIEKVGETKILGSIL